MDPILFPVALALALATPIVARDPGEVRPLRLGARVGWAFPFGEAAPGARTSDSVVGAAPLQLDLGWRADRRVVLGAYAAFAPTVPTLCRDASDCVKSIGSDVRAGALVTFYPTRAGAFEPWFGVGAGYEWLTAPYSDAGAVSTRRYSGAEYALLELGLDWRRSSAFAFGPYASVALGGFDHAELSTPAGRFSRSPDPVARHGWLVVGVRSGWDL
jgi:hypothetical protein